MTRSVSVSTAAVALGLLVLASWLRLEGLTRGEVAPAAARTEEPGECPRPP